MELYKVDSVVRKDYWLIVPPMESEAFAKKLLQQLQKSNIESYLIADGEYRYGITLGVFSGEENTIKYQKTLIAKGYQVEIKVLPRKENTYWLEINKQNLIVLPVSFLQDLNKEEGLESVQMKEAICGKLKRAVEARPTSV